MKKQQILTNRQKTERLRELIQLKSENLEARSRLFSESLELDEQISQLQGISPYTSSKDLFSRSEIYNDFK